MPSSSQDVIFAFVLNELKREVIVGFDGIGGIVDHHCLYFRFINWYQLITLILPRRMYIFQNKQLYLI